MTRKGLAYALRTVTAYPDTAAMFTETYWLKLADHVLAVAEEFDRQQGAS